MPEREYDCLARDGVVVDVVPHSIQLEAAQFRLLARRAALTNPRLHRQQLCGGLEVVGDHSRCCGPVCSPPLGRSFKLSQCARRDLDRVHRRSMSAQLAERFGDGDRLAAEGLSDGFV